MRKITNTIVVILLIGVIVINSIFIYNLLKEDIKAEDEFEELAEIVQQEIDIEDNEVENKHLNLQELYQINSDVIGWIRIEGTNINYPVMQSKYNSNYYLRRSIYKEYSVWGTPYLAEECDINSSNNLIIYGHHIRGNKLFGELEKFKNKEFLNNHKLIEFTTLDKVHYYEIIDVVVIDTSDSSISKYYNSNYMGENSDKLITLSTCEYSTKDGRLLVIGKQKRR